MSIKQERRTKKYLGNIGNPSERSQRGSSTLSLAIQVIILNSLKRIYSRPWNDSSVVGSVIVFTDRGALNYTLGFPLTILNCLSLRPDAE